MSVQNFNSQAGLEVAEKFGVVNGVVVGCGLLCLTSNLVTLSCFALS